MSQITFYDKSSILPDIETVTGNFGGPVGPDGAFNLNLVGTYPIVVTGNPATNTQTISIASMVSGTGETIGLASADLISFDLGVATKVYCATIRIAGYGTPGDEATGMFLTSTIRTTVGIATVINTTDAFTNCTDALKGCTATVVAVGNNLVVRVTGVVGRTIRWTATLDYTATA